MNEDESTQSMSDKVIDRAPVIRFARPKILADRPPQPQSNSVDPSSYLPLQTWLQWRRDLDSLSHDVRDNIEKWINRLNKELDVFGRPFGHRLNQAILAYVANHPDMISDPSLANARKAFADQLEQRIFPKLRGLEMEDNLNDKSYKEILDLVKEDLKDEELADALDKSKKNILFTWVGVNREEEK
jgi:5-methylcytosine-specific restriction endonuclease McrBC GTP-binding regulatory subunit McrB